MAYTGLMEVEGTKYKVRHCTYSLHQNVDENGRPSSQVMGGTMQIEVESSDDTKLIDWMVDKTGKKSGKLEFSKTDEEGTLKTIEFEDAFLTSYTESMDAISNSPMVENLVISAKSISVNGVKHENIWASKL
jgi:hypothetical protein